MFCHADRLLGRRRPRSVPDEALAQRYRPLSSWARPRRNARTPSSLGKYDNDRKRMECAQNTPIVTSGREAGLPLRPLPSDMISSLFSEAPDQAICGKRRNRLPSRPLDGRRSRSRLSQLVRKWQLQGVRPNTQSAGFADGGVDAVDSGLTAKGQRSGMSPLRMPQRRGTRQKQ